MGLRGLFRRHVESLAVIRLHGGTPDGRAWGDLLCRHLTWQLGAATGLPALELSFLYTTGDGTLVGSNVVIRDRALRAVESPRLDEETALFLLEQTKYSHVLWGSVDVDAEIVADLHVSPKPRGDAPPRHRLRAPRGTAGGALDDAVRWLVRVAGHPPSVPLALAGVPTGAFELFYEVQATRDRLVGEDRPWSEIITEVTGRLLDGIDRFGDVPLLHRALLEECLRAHDLDAAARGAGLAALDRAQQLLPDDPRVLGFRGLLLSEDDPEGAEAAYAETVERFPNHAEGWMGLARVLYEHMAREPTARTEANVRRVLELSAKALELNDDLPYAHLMHGDQLANIGRVEAARGHWARCVDMAADGPEGRIAENRLQATE